MEKLMRLFDFEFKRNFKNYLVIVITMCIALMAHLIFNVRKFNKTIDELLKTKTMEEITDRSQALSFDNIINEFTIVIFVVGLGVCLLYSIYIWEREFLFKNKSISTLMMMPQGRGKVYISKLLNIVCLAYMYIMSFTMTLFIAYKILPKYMSGSLVSMGFVEDTIYKLGANIPYNFTDFIVGYIFLLSALISFLFTCTLRVKTIKNTIAKAMIGMLFIVSLPFLLFFGVMLVALDNSNIIVMAVSTISVIVFYKLSTYMLNNKIDF